MSLHIGDSWRSISLDEARFWLNDRIEKAVRVEVMLNPPDGMASAITTMNGLLLHWRDRFPEAGGDPEGATAWYAIGTGENDPTNYIKTSFNLSRLPEDTKVLALDAMLHIEIGEGVWLSVREVGQGFA
jgi:hypothetical protein